MSSAKGPNSAFKRRNPLNNFTLAFIAIGLVVVGVGVFVVRDIRRSNQNVRQMYAGLVHGLDLASELQYQAQEARRSMLYALTTTDSNLQLEYTDQSRMADTRVYQLIQEEYNDASPRIKTSALNLESDWARYLVIRDEVIAAILEGSVKGAVQLDLREGVPAFDQVRNDLQAIKQLRKEEAEQQLAQVETSSNQSLLKLITILCLTQLIAAVAVKMVQKGKMLSVVQRSEVRLGEVIESINEGMFVIGSGERVELWNDAAERMSGRRREFVIGHLLSEAFPKLESSLLPAALAEARRTSKASVLPELRFNGDDSDSIFDAHIFPFEGGTTVFFNDVTESKRADEALRESEEKYRELFENAHDIVYTRDLEGNYTSLNKACEKITGYTVEESLTMNMAQIIAPEYAQKITEWSAHDKQNKSTYELEIIAKGGKRVTLEVNSRLTYQHGKAVGVQGIARDITERKRMEAELEQARDVALESARLKSEFLANMSHEIRTPMNGVIGMTGLLLDTELNAEQREFAETISSSGNSLLTIINDILDFSKIEAGKLHFEKLDFDLSHAVEGTVELLAEQARDKQIELASLIHSDVPTELQGDPGRLRQVLMNLIGNAVKFTEAGEVIVRAEKESESGNDVVIRFTVSDTGIGISDGAQQHLFQAFTQADGSTTRKYGGTGLGLAISKQLVELMGGEIGLHSEAGKGSTFWFTARFDKQPAEVINAQRTAPSMEGMRVLIVDDNATNRKILSHQLSSWKMIHDEAQSGTHALELLHAAATAGAAYDLAILDLMMPGMDGFQLARTIKSDPGIATVRLVLLTSFGQRGDSTTAREAGISAYLMKPVRQSQLFDCLVSVVDQPAVVSKRITGTFGSVPKLVTRHTLAERTTISHKLILVAEDNIVNQKVAVRQLQKIGYRADAVANGREALEALARIPYELVLMDCQMPEMDGYETTAEIRRREGSAKHTTIIAMTAHALEGDREKCIAAGMDDYISKPVNAENLKQVLDRLLSDAGKEVSNNSATTHDSPPVDLERLYLAVGEEPEELSDILGIYVSQMTENLARLDTAIASGNASEVDQIAHNCAGTSANCGISALVAPFYELERMGRENQLAGAAVLSAQAAGEFERVKLFLHEHLELAVA